MSEPSIASAAPAACELTTDAAFPSRRGRKRFGKPAPSRLLLWLVARSSAWLTTWWARRAAEVDTWRAARAAARKQPQRMHFEALEPRVLMSGDLSPSAHLFAGPGPAEVQHIASTQHALAVNLTPAPDPDGTVATVVVTGPGSATLTPQGSSYQLAVTGTDATSKLTLTTRGGDGKIVLAGLSTDAAIGDLALASADLAGSAAFAGTVGSARFGQLQGASLTFAGSGDTSLTLDAVRDSHIHADRANLSLTAASLNASSAGASSVDVAGLKKLAVSGDSNADFALSGNTITGYVLGTVKVDGALSGGTWSVHGRASAIQAGSTAEAWKLNVDNTLGQLVTQGDASGAVAVAGLQLLQVGGSTRSLTVLVGADLGNDAVLGGSADTFKAGTLARVRVSGDMVDTKIYVSVDPVDGRFGDGDDRQLGSVVQRLQEFAVGGVLKGSTSVVAPAFPTTVRIGGQSLAPTAVPSLGTTPADTVAPVIAGLRLGNDTGTSSTDRLTRDATVVLQVNEAGAVAGFQARLGGRSFQAVSPVRQTDGTYLVSPAQLATLNGGTLADADYTLELFATDLAGNRSATAALSFTLDGTAPGASRFGLDPASDTGTQGDNSTTASLVKLVGLAEAGAAISLRRSGSTTDEATTVAANDGSFGFDGVALPVVGANGFTLVLTDRAGNSQRQSFTITREAGQTGTDTTAPTVTAALTNDSGRSATDGLTRDATVRGTAADDIGVTRLLAVLDAGATPVFTDITSSLRADGSFTLTPAQLATLAGGTLADGSHSLRLVARDAAGNSSAPIDVRFTLDTQAPTGASVALSTADALAGSETRTAAGVVQLRGVAEAGSTVSLAAQGLSAQAGEGGVFVLPGVTLALGDNALVLAVTDAAGNSQTLARTLTRVAQTRSDAVLTWNSVALQAIQRDDTDPPVATRTLAIQSVAVYDTLAAIEGTPAFLVQRSVSGAVSADAAAAYAAYRVLYLAYPAQRDALDLAIQTSLAAIADGDAKTAGIALGRSIADAVIAIRASDGYLDFATEEGGTAVGQWRPTGPMFLVAQDPQWADLKPFVLTSNDEFRAPPPPALDSPEYAAAINEVESLGSATSTTRTADQTQQALFWQDGGGSYTPPGHWNAIAAQVAADMGNSLSANARLMAQLNVALADAAVACWDTKYTYVAWRPVTAIQNADIDGNAATTQDPNWRSLLINPPHPDYVSGHSTFSAAAAGVLAATFGDATAFSTTSPTLPDVTRRFTSFSQAADEAGLSRIYGGIHTPFANAAGQVIGAKVADAVLARFKLTDDTQAPSVVLADSQAATHTNLTLTGQVLDNLSGVASAQWRLDDGALQSFSFDADGKFSLTTALALDGSKDGAHVITIFARDAAGNLSAGDTRAFTLDTKAPTLALTSLAEGAALGAVTQLTGTANGTGSDIVSLRYTVDGGTAKTLTYDPALGTFDQVLRLGNIDVGAHTLTFTALDAAGNTATLTRHVSLPTAAPFAITKVAPATEVTDVGVTYRPQVFFSRAVNAATLTADTFYATGPDGTRLDMQILPAADGSFAWLLPNQPMPGGSTITLHVRGSAIRAALDGAFLDADSDGVAGGDLAYSFTTASTTSVLGARLVGKVVDPGPDLDPMTFDDIGRGPDGVIHTADDIFKLPIAHALVSIIGRPDLSTYTDAAGNFSFDSVPVGDVKLAVDGRTATNPPAGVFFPEMVLDLTLKPGVTNTAMSSMGTTQSQADNAGRPEIYLPRVQTASLQNVSDTAPTTITMDAKSAPEITDAQRSEMTLDIAPGTAIGFDGQVMSNVKIGINTVPPEIVKDMLPAGVMQHTFDITIQAPGVDVFSVPQRITFPNVFNAAAGTQLNILSFDHTTGRLVINGTATVSADGKTVVSDEGSGILAPGWHGMAPPGGPSSPPCDPTVPKDVDVPPVPLVASAGPDGVYTYGTLQDFYFKDDSGNFTLSIANDAKAIDPSKDPCDPVNEHATPLIVKITVEGNTGSGAFLNGLPPTMEFSLAPQQIKNIKVDVIAMLTAAGLDAAAADKLYGAQIKVEGYKSDASGMATGPDLINQHFFAYRFLDVADDNHSDGKVEFIKTFIDGLGKAYNEIPYVEEMPASAKPTYRFDSSGSAIGTNFEVHPATLRFDPISIAGDRTDKFHITAPDGKEVGSVDTRGTAVGAQKVKFSEADFTASVKQVVDNPIGTMTKFLSIFPAVTTPGDKPSSAPGFAAFVHQLYLDAKSAIYADYATVDPLTASALDIEDTNAGDGIAVQWKNTYTLLFGTIVINPLNGTTAANAKWADFSDTTFEPNAAAESQVSTLQSAYDFAAVTNKAPSDYLNVNLNQLSVNNEIGPQAATEATFAQFLGNTIGHEIGHDLGAIHFRGLLPGQTYLPGSIMGTDSNLTTVASFGANFNALIDYSLGLPATLAAFTTTDGYYKTYSPLDHGLYTYDDAASPNHGDEHDLPPYPSLNLFAAPSVRGQAAPAELRNLDFGSTVADGTGSNRVDKTVYLVSDGTAPVTISNIKLTGAGAGAYSIVSSTSLPLTLAGRELDDIATPFATQAITLRYDPSTVGAAVATLEIYDDATAGQAQKVALTGTAIAAKASIGIAIDNNNVGGQALGGGAKQSNGFATVTNNGAQPLTISAVQLDGASNAFKVVGLPAGLDAAHPIVLATGQSFKFDLSFAPDKLGLQNARLTIVSNDPDTPVAARTVVGTGTGSVASTLHFGGNYIGLESIDNPAGAALHTISGKDGMWSLFLPANERVHYVAFDPISGLISHAYDQTAASGRTTMLTGGTFAASTAPDTDGDGLPDDIEFAIGSNARSVDTNKDGIDDFASIQQGINPLGNLGVPTGVLAATTLTGGAQAVAVGASTTDATHLTAYVATGSQGLSIVDVSKFTKPTVLGGIDLTGTSTDIAVDAARNIAAVASNDAGLHLVDVSDPTTPKLLQTVAFGAPVTAVQIRDGLAYAATGDSIAVVDLNTGEIRSTLDLGAAAISGIAIEGTELYTMDASQTLRAVSLAGNVPVVDGSLTVSGLSNGGGKVFVGNGVAYLSSEGAFQGGFETVDVRNPKAMKLVSGVDDIAIAGRAIALNGSGLGVSVGSPGGVFGTHDLDVLDTRSSGDTGKLVTRYALPQAPLGLALANGLAFVADGSGGLQIVNFIGFDSAGVPPTVSITVDGVDVDPTRAGIQILEGRSVQVKPTVSDDVQVRTVELLVNGKVVSNDAAFPFELFAQAPTLASGGNKLTLQVRATDTGGNSTLSAPVVLDVVPDTFPPVLKSASVDDGARRFFVRSIDFGFDEPLDTARLTTAAVQLVQAGADGAFGTADDVTVPITLDFRARGQSVSVLPSGYLAPGEYRLTIAGSAVSDLAGNKLAANIVRSFSIRPASDVRAASGVPDVPTAPSANPGQQIGIVVPFDPATGRAQFGTIDANGTTSTVVVAASRWDTARGLAYFNVPVNALTGDVVVYGLVGTVRTDFADGTFPLQIVPLVTGLEVQSVSADGASAVVVVSGRGFVEGNNSEYRFGSLTLLDAGATTGPDVQQVYDPSIGQYVNGQVTLTVPLSGGVFGAVAVKTAGGVSASFSVSLSGVSATALSGTPADATRASANPGQAITLQGTGLSTSTDVLLRYTDYNGAAAMVKLNPSAAAADGKSATLIVPTQANGAFALQVFGSATQPLLQIVPVLKRFDETGGNLALQGAGFVEGATRYDFAGQSVNDTLIAAGVDVSYFYDSTAGAYVFSGQANLGAADLPRHGLGNVTVTTAGGTSAPLALNALRPGSDSATVGALGDVAVDPTTGALWVVDVASPGHLLRIDAASGSIVQTITFDATAPYAANSIGLQVLPQAMTLAGTSVAKGSLLVFNGYYNQIVAVNPATGAVIARLTPPQNYSFDAGVYDAATGHFFVLANSSQLVELDPATGATVAAHALATNVQSWAGLAIDPTTGNLWVGSYSQASQLVLYNRSGTEQRRIDLASQGVNDNEVSGLAFAPDGSLRVASTSGVVYKVAVVRDEATRAATLTQVIALATDGTPANAAVVSANVGQLIELRGSNFGDGTQVLFNTRDNAGKTAVVAVRPQLVDASGTRLQVLVPALATTGDIRVSNIGTANLGFGSAVDSIHRQVTATFTAGAANAAIRFSDGGLQSLDDESWGLDNVVVRQGAAIVFQDNFEGGAKSAWSNSRTDRTQTATFSEFSGRFNNTSQTLNLGGLTAGQTYTLSFDFLAIDSWDGNDPALGPDVIDVSVDGTSVLQRTVSNFSLANAQTLDASAPVRLQIVPTLTGLTGRPGSDTVFNVLGSGFMEAATTVTIGGVALADKSTVGYPFDVTGSRNDTISVVAPLTLDGPIRITTEGGYAQIATPVAGVQPATAFTAITTTAASGVAADAGQPSANTGQTLTLVGQGFTASTLVQFQGLDDRGALGTITRTGSVSANGTLLTLTVPALARSGAVTVLGSNTTIALQVVPTLRSLGGTVAAGNTVVLEGSGLTANDLAVQIDGRPVGNFSVRTVYDGSSPYSADQQLLTLVVPNGVGAGVVTVSTAGGSTALRRGATITALPALTPAAEVGDTLADAQPLALGANQSVVVNSTIGGARGALDVDLYRLTLAAGEQLTLNMANASSLYAYLRIFDATGQQVYISPSYFYNNASNAPVQWTAPAAGTYTIGVSGYANTGYDPKVAGSGSGGSYSGNYALSVERSSAVTTRLTGLTATAASGTPNQSGIASANTGQTVTFTGSGLLATDALVFSVIDSNGRLYEQTVAAASVAADGTSLTAVVPASATTGHVRLARETVGLLLQIVPTLTDLSMTPGSGFIGGTLSLTGSGFAEGSSSVYFGALRVDDLSPSYGLDASNTTISLTVPDGASTGPIRVATTGGTSAAFGASLTGITATAASGTPTTAQASANPGQLVTLSGSGFDTTLDIVFQVIDYNGTRSELVVRPNTLNATSTQVQVTVPQNAVTGTVRIVGDRNAAALALQIVPLVTGVEVQSVSADGTSAVVVVSGRGFVEGNNSEYRFGSLTLLDAGATTGPDVQQVYDPSIGQYVNGQVTLTVPLSGGVFGAVAVKTAGGVSASFSVSLSGVSATALSGTPADATRASANPGQAITLQGTGLSTSTDVLLRYTDYNGAAAMVKLNPSAAAADGKSATLIVPTQANGAFALQVFGSATQPLLQIVPVLKRFDETGGNLALQGAGFVEGATRYDFAGQSVNDTLIAAGVDVSYFYDSTAGAYVFSGQANLGAADLPRHGLGNVTVTTAGGTSAPLALNALRPGSDSATVGALGDVAVDPTTGALWVVDVASPGHLLRIDAASGSIVQTITFDATAPYAANSIGLQVLPQAMTLAGTSVAKGSLLVFNGYYNQIVAVNPATGAVIARLTPPQNYSFDAGVYDAATGHFFVLANSSQLVELDPATGATVAAHALATNVQSWAGLAIDPTTGNLWVGSYSQASQLVLYNRSGTEQRRIDLASQGVNDNEVSGLAFAPDGSLRVASTSGVVYKVAVGG